MGLLERSAWRGQKNNAKDRGIEFRFTYEEWIAWWEDELGPDWMKLRGCKKGQYVMARHLDKGAYEAGNVKCVLSGSNHAEYNSRSKRGRKKKPHRRILQDDEIKTIYLKEEKCYILAKRFGVTAGWVERIKRGEKYAEITAPLGPPGRIKHWRISLQWRQVDELFRR